MLRTSSVSQAHSASCPPSFAAQVLQVLQRGSTPTHHVPRFALNAQVMSRSLSCDSSGGAWYASTRSGAETRELPRGRLQLSFEHGALSTSRRIACCSFSIVQPFASAAANLPFNPLIHVHTYQFVRDRERTNSKASPGTELIIHHMSGQAKPAPAPVQDEDDEFEE